MKHLEKDSINERKDKYYMEIMDKKIIENVIVEQCKEQDVFRY